MANQAIEVSSKGIKTVKVGVANDLLTLATGETITLVRGAGMTTRLLKPLGLGTTGRTISNNLVEEIAMRNVLEKPTLGKPIMNTVMNDARWSGWTKMQYTVTSENGAKAVIHYVGKFENGVLIAVDDFKFK